MRLEYSREAITDLKRLRAFIAEHNPTAAKRIASELKQGIQALKSHPKLGHGVSQAPDPETIRDLVPGKYIVRYLLLPERVVVLDFGITLRKRGNHAERVIGKHL